MDLCPLSSKSGTGLATINFNMQIQDDNNINEKTLKITCINKFSANLTSEFC